MTNQDTLVDKARNTELAPNTIIQGWFNDLTGLAAITVSRPDDRRREEIQTLKESGYTQCGGRVYRNATESQIQAAIHSCSRSLLERSHERKGRHDQLPDVLDLSECSISPLSSNYRQEKENLYTHTRYRPRDFM